MTTTTENLLNLQNNNNQFIKDFYNFDLNQALDYTCARLTKDGDKATFAYCGKCDTCSITNNLMNIREWLPRASHLTIKQFVCDLIKSIKNKNIYEYLNNLLKPAIESKDYTYSRNKLLPSVDLDHLKPTNDRCLSRQYISKSITSIISWYSSSSSYIKLNFLLSLLKECDHSIITLALLQIQTITEAPRTLSGYMSETNYDDSAHIKNENTLKHRQRNNRSISNKTSSTIVGMNVTATDDSDYTTDGEIVCDNEETSDSYGEFDINVLYSNTRVQRRAKYVDFIRQLPIHLAKNILTLLNRKTLKNCAFVSKYWNTVVREVYRETSFNQSLIEDMMLLRGTSSKITNPKYANDIDVRVPNLLPNSIEVKLNENEEEQVQKTKLDYNWENAYSGVSTRYVIMEERNVFCGSYNVLLLKEKRDPHRVVHLNGKNLVAHASFDKVIRFIDIRSAVDSNLRIHGHAGSIRCLFMCEVKNIIITGSYDTSLRCWNIQNGKCMRIFQGHQKTVNCIDFDEEYERIISGSQDKTAKVWLLKNRGAWRTFKHKYSITAVAIREDMCVTGGVNGKVKVFKLNTGQLIKTFACHQSLVTAIKFDKWHIVTTSTDGFALAFSAQGTHKKCLIALRHPKAVNCLEFQYLKAITGCADGKIRIWNILNGDCLRVMRGNSQCDPILSLHVSFNRILINTQFNVLLMEFENIKYEYGSSREIESDNFTPQKDPAQNERHKRPYTAIRANRMEFVGTPNVKLFNDERKSVMSHSSGPISNKTLEDAKVVQNTRSSMSYSKLSVITVNTPMTFRTTPSSTYNKSALSYVNVQSQINLSAARKQMEETRKNTLTSNTSFKEFKLDIQLDDDQVNLFRYKKLTLDETKILLRNQLRNIKQAGVTESTTRYVSSAGVKSHELRQQIDTKSCAEGSAHAHEDDYKTPSTEVRLRRPTSSPAKYDTRTKYKIKASELKRMLNVDVETNELKSESKMNVSHHTTASKSTMSSTPIPTASNINDQSLNTSRKSVVEKKEPEKPVVDEMKKPYVCKSAVTKVFSMQEGSLRTNTEMYPKNVQSKLPNPKIVNVIRPATSFETYSEKEGQPKEPRIKTADAKLGHFFPQTPEQEVRSLDQHKRPPINQRLSSAPVNRPKTPANTLSERKQKTQTAQIVETYATNKLVMNDDLKLMTFKQIDDIMHRIVNEASKVKAKPPIDEKSNKKLWLLKSTGLYHGSLLAKPKPLAPEIRE